MWLTIEITNQPPVEVEVRGERSTIGSDASCDIVVADEEISPRHAELRALPDGRLEIEDLDSRAGTWVGGVRLGGPATLEGGERLSLGRTDVTASLERPDPADPEETGLTRRETVRRLVAQSRRATLLAGAALVIAALAVALAAAGAFSGADQTQGLSTREIVEMTTPGTTIVVALGNGARVGNGTGWVLDAGQGLIVTNAHVVDAGQTFEVGTDNNLVSADVVGVAPCDDLAVLKASETDGLETLPLGSQSTLEQGDPVVAVGYPGNASPDDEVQVTTGIVSVVGETFDVPGDPSVQLYPNVVQTDAPINPGNSGGPLVDSEGRLVGVNTLIFRGRRGEIEGQGYAIGVDRVKEVVAGLREGDSQGWEGFAFRPFTAREARSQGAAPGLLVTSVVPGTPAAQQGIAGGRAIIVAVDGQPVTSFREYCDAIDSRDGETVDFNVLEPGGPRQIRLEL